MFSDPPGRLLRAALRSALPDHTALDAVEVREGLLSALAVSAREFLLAHTSPEFQGEVLEEWSLHKVAVVAAATSIARDVGQDWPWREALELFVVKLD
jgi:hypothetical protein